MAGPLKLAVLFCFQNNIVITPGKSTARPRTMMTMEDTPFLWGFGPFFRGNSRDSFPEGATVLGFTTHRIHVCYIRLYLSTFG